jgi:ferredoxin
MKEVPPDLWDKTRKAIYACPSKALLTNLG